MTADTSKPRLCRKGLHPLTSENTYPSNGACKICAAERERRYREANRDKRKAQQKQYRETNRELIRKRWVRQYAKNGEAIRAWQSANYRANRDAILERNAKYRAANRDAIRAQKAERRDRLRQAALDAYGHQCTCCGLGMDDIFLTFDHVLGGGAEHRRKLKLHGGETLHKWLLDEGYPPDFQVLCWSCNGAKRLYPSCPHQSPVIPQNAGQRHRRKLKAEVIQAYGGRCACCGEGGVDFLHIDHVNGGGKQHRKSLAGNASEFYPTLRKLGFPNDPPLRVLCGNCNHAVRFGPCPHQMADSQPATPRPR